MEQEQKPQVKVQVIGMTGKRLMPATPRKAGKASVCQRDPFTVRLNCRTGGAVQY